MRETYLQSDQLGFQVLYTLDGVFCLALLITRRTKGLEFLDDGLGFVHLGLFSQSLEFLQTVVLSW